MLLGPVKAIEDCDLIGGVSILTVCAITTRGSGVAFIALRSLDIPYVDPLGSGPYIEVSVDEVGVSAIAGGW